MNRQLTRRLEFAAAVWAMLLVSGSWSLLQAQIAQNQTDVAEINIQVEAAQPVPPRGGGLTPAAGNNKSDEKEKKQPEPAPATEPPRLVSGMDADAIRLHLMDGSVISGKLALKEIAIETQYGALSVPVEKIRSFTPGLQSHPTFSKQVAGWIAALGSSNFNEREKAQQQLEKLPNLRAELEQHQQDADTERRNRVLAILAKFEEDEADAAPASDTWKLQQRDVIETVDFTIVGKIVPQSFALTSQYGPLTIQLSDIRGGQRDLAKREDVRQTLTVDASHFAHKSPLVTNLRLERGDKVTITAEGTMQMQPWGNGAQATPEGNPQYGWFIGNQIPMCALIGRVGANDQFFKIGNRYQTTVERSGVLHLAIGMNNDYNQNQFPGKFTVKIVIQKKNN